MEFILLPRHYLANISTAWLMCSNCCQGTT